MRTGCRSVPAGPELPGSYVVERHGYITVALRRINLKRLSTWNGPAGTGRFPTVGTGGAVAPEGPRQDLTAPSMMPATICLPVTTNTTSSGIVARQAAAIIRE